MSPPTDGPAPTRAARVRAALAALHGCASARAIAEHLAREADGPGPTVRQVREALRQRDITRLGGGYHALPACADRPLGPWLRARLARMGPMTVARVVDDVLLRWPHGDPAAVEGWLHQDPDGTVVIDGVVRLPGQRGAPLDREDAAAVLHPRPRATGDGCS